MNGNRLPNESTRARKQRRLTIAFWVLNVILVCAVTLRPLYGPPLASVLTAGALGSQTAERQQPRHLALAIWVVYFLNPETKWVRELQVAATMQADSESADASKCRHDLEMNQSLVNEARFAFLHRTAALCYARSGVVPAAIREYEDSERDANDNRDIPPALRPPPVSVESVGAGLLIGAGDFYGLPGDAAVNRRVARALFEDARRANPTLIAKIHYRRAATCAHKPHSRMLAAICAYGP
jgi:hypothetical protein